MGVTDVSAFPCCGKSSVDIVERTNDYYHTHGKAEEEEPELEAELPKQDPLPKAHPDPDLGPVPQLEEMEPAVSSAPTSKAKGDCVTESPEQQNYRLEPLKSYEKDRKEWSPTNRTWTLSTNSSKREEGQVSDEFRSIRVQTSKHLFWSNKLIQASEHSLQRALEKHKSSREKKSVTISQALTDSAPRPASPHMSYTSLPTAMGLADLINFASSLAVASSSNVETPNLENMIKVTSEKSQNTSLELCQPVQAIEFAQATQISQISSEKPNKSPKDTSHNSWTQETRNVSYLDISKNGLKKATIQGEVKFVQASSTSPPFQGAKEEPPQKPGNLLTRHSYEEQAGRGHKGRALRQPEPPTATPTKEDRTTLKGKEFKGDGATNPHWSGPDARPQSVTDDSLLPLTSRQLAAFQDVFKLFSCSPTGTVDMHSMKMALRHVGMQLGPQEMCEALRLADLDGDGIVSFKDFLGVLTDNHRLAQCMVHMKNSRSYEPQGLQTLFLEVLFKLLSQGFVPFRSRQEMISYYFKKQRALRLSMCGNRRARGQGRPARAHTGLTFFCQAARLGGLSSSQLALSLHTLYRAGGRSPYAQIPSLTGRPRPEHRISNRALGSDVRLPKPEKPGRPKLPPSLWPLGKGPLRPPAGLVSQPVEQMRPQKLSPSPTTLVQRHPNSPSPAYFQRSAMKSLYK